ncbi:Transposase DDE domain protein [Anaerohalosphaera lusitana]|uniref:Transposase DDE domain protein n=1 Tax=Anaerohalosphaera lusitana TaxID=1936003 RepID=A0A1U9NNL8_9BACT|nr:IS5 family transposase [Anaerohalosphaera lusitana]AQT69210.1 Transposase DDE domain protein [Anaerohalosphaera lusitana]AQT69605.1 Transposase DDE domain protein [Anaerohalosphaera lusitana]
MMQVGLFDWQTRFEQLDNSGDPLVKLNEIVDWEQFRKTLEIVRDKKRKSNAGRKPFDVILMFKILILDSLYNISDDQLEFQIRDRISFMRFLGLGIGDRVPDAKTIWLFREQLTEAGLVENLFTQFDEFLRKNGFSAKKGQIVDASIVAVPKQRNTRDENKSIKNGEVPENWSDTKKRQKDTDARWVQKNGVNYYGYKNHIDIDVKHKFIRSCEVTPASVHDSNVFEDLLDANNSSKDVWADSAYGSTEKRDNIKEEGYRGHIQRKGCRYKKLTQRQIEANYKRSKTRSRVEHVFGIQKMRAGNLIIRTIGIARAKTKICMRNLAYNIDRYCLLARL